MPSIASLGRGMDGWLILGLVNGLVSSLAGAYFMGEGYIGRFGRLTKPSML